MRYKRIILSILLIVPILFGSIYVFNSFSPAKEEIIHGKTIPYKDFADMEKETHIVIIGEKLKTSENIITRDEELDKITDAYSIAEFKIIKVLNNKLDTAFKKMM